MHLKISQLVKNAVYALFLGGFLWVGFSLFITSDEELSEEVALNAEELRVLYPDEPVELSPEITDPAVHQRTLNIYEPLVRADADLNMKPALALSWGLVNPTLWEFNLRPDVLFHNGSVFDADDVLASLELVDIDGVTSVEKIDDLVVQVATLEPDPLLLQRISNVLIFSADNEGEGTGPYKVVQWQDGEMVFERFEGYWGVGGAFQRVVALTEVDKSQRVARFVNGEADVLTFVPFEGVQFVEDEGFEIVALPNLEVQFLLFNTESPRLRNVKARRVLAAALNREELIARVGNFAHEVGQYVSNGVFGYNPDLEPYEFDLDFARKEVRAANLSGRTLQLHLPIGLNVLGEQIRTDFADAGVNVVVSYLNLPELQMSISERSADIYFLGFKSELGDSAPFFEEIVKSDADFNLSGYSNEEVDDLIDLALESLDDSVRLESLQEAMRIVMEDAVIGVPLFEYENVFAFSDAVDFQPRIDGFVYYSEIKPTK